jgi:hemin uptake protein HemP
MLLCLLLFDDAALQKMLPRPLLRILSARTEPKQNTPRAVSRLVGAWGVLLVFCSLVQMDARFGGNPPALARDIDQLVEPLRMVSSYGLFAVMTTQRNEIVIEGSHDGTEWREYEFRYKPGDLARRPPWNLPHQPRLDWQMWFAALDDPRRVSWFARFLEKLLENEPRKSLRGCGGVGGRWGCTSPLCASR